MSAFMRLAACALALSLAACGGSAQEDTSEAEPLVSAGPKATDQAQMLKEKGVDEAAGKRVGTVPDEVQRTPDEVLVTVDLDRHIGNRDLGYYLLRPEEWTLLKVDQIAPTVRTYKFRRIASHGDLRQMLDPLAPRK